MKHVKLLLNGTVLGLALTLAIAAPTFAAAAIDFGDNSSEWANDTECDDPRFEGAGMADEVEDTDTLKDAADCQAAFEAGTITLKAAEIAPPPASDDTTAAIDFGDDTGQYPKDGDCDDPRFTGAGAIESAEAVDEMHDATDCKAAFDAGTITLKVAGQTTATQPLIGDINFGDDEGGYPKDGECDDPRFEGTAAADEPDAVNILHDATDCRAAFGAGTVTMKTTTAVADFDFGTDTSKYAYDDVCDDPRFMGSGVDKKLLDADKLADATDCRTLMESGAVMPRPVYQANYVAGAPYDATGIDFGDNTSAYSGDGECDDPRFEGPGGAANPLYENKWHDADDCSAAFASGSVALLP